jgi:synaptojanin
MWEKYLVDTFTAQTGSTYILYRSEQVPLSPFHRKSPDANGKLVGTALFIIVKSSLTSAIRNVESATKKTGLQGLSGNKGGVGIRFNLFDSTVCLMTCHLAAGHSNVNERNADYKTISGGLKFLKGKSIEDHEYVLLARCVVILGRANRQLCRVGCRFQLPDSHDE